jgi:hypothetical protein
MSNALRYKAYRAQSCIASSFFLPSLSQTPKPKPGCYYSYAQLVQNPDATRQDSEKFLRARGIWLSTDAMREALLRSHHRKRARVHVSPPDWLDNINTETDINARSGLRAHVLSSRWLVGLVGTLDMRPVSMPGRRIPCAMDHSLGMRSLCQSGVAKA